MSQLWLQGAHVSRCCRRSSNGERLCLMSFRFGQRDAPAAGARGELQSFMFSNKGRASSGDTSFWIKGRASCGNTWGASVAFLCLRTRGAPAAGTLMPHVFSFWAKGRQQLGNAWGVSFLLCFRARGTPVRSVSGTTPLGTGRTSGTSET